MSCRSKRSPSPPRLRTARFGQGFTSAATVLGAVCWSAVLASCQQGSARDVDRDSAPSVTVVPVERHRIDEASTASGMLVPRADIEVFPQITGYRVAKVLVDVGDRVTSGQPLVELDDTLIHLQVDQQAALSAEKRALAEQAQAQANRVNGDSVKNILPREQIESRRFAAKVALAEADAQDAALREMRMRESLTMVRARNAGIVIERNVRVGDLAGATSSTPFFRLAANGQIDLAADCSESVLNRLRAGAPASVTLSNGTELRGAVRLISPTIDPTTNMGRVYVSLPVRPDIRPGSFGRVAFAGATDARLAVPESAVRYDADGSAVMVVGADNHLSRVPVTVGWRGGGYAELINGPAAGSSVVMRASAMLVSGQIVRPVPPK